MDFASECRVSEAAIGTAALWSKPDAQIFFCVPFASVPFIHLGWEPGTIPTLRSAQNFKNAYQLTLASEVSFRWQAMLKW
jgi:hypothetical protein